MSDPPPLPRAVPPHMQLPAPKRKSTSGMNPGAIVALALAVPIFIVISVAVMLPAITRAREGARRAECQGHLKHIGMACELYTEKNDGQLPPTRNVLHQQVPFDAESLICPSSDDQPGNMDDIDTWTSYKIVFSGPAENTADLVIVQEKDEQAHIPLGRNYLFTDGHVEFRRMQSIEPMAERAP